MTKGFNDQCYKLLKRVPCGKVVTYKEIARKIGSLGYRAVGNAMNKNKDLIHVHCYKVVRSDGKVGGYAKGFQKKVFLLKRDGILVVNGRIDLKKYGWKF
jgi:methylated-DNA-[protein]-cysteine S-methyltransferase